MTTVEQETQQVVYELRVLNSNGDSRYAHSPGSTATVAPDGTELLPVAEVEAKFNEIVKGLKYLAYTVPADGSTGTAIRDFDPKVDIVAVPQMQGG